MLVKNLWLTVQIHVGFLVKIILVIWSMKLFKIVKQNACLICTETDLLYMFLNFACSVSLPSELGSFSSRNGLRLASGLVEKLRDAATVG